VIHSDQAGFIAGRLITDQTRFLKLLIDRADKEGKSRLIVALDQEKAYD
jgi:hypothetical protein